jgi:RNA polymerase sigma-70 factor, ECF subfamily
METTLALSKSIICRNRMVYYNLMPDQFGLSIKLGDERSFELFFRMYYVRLCSFANKFLNDPEEAKEIVQDAFAKIWEGRNDINPEDSLKSYIFKITQNLCLNKLKRGKVESRFVEIYKLVYIEQHEFSAHDSLLTKELEENIRTAVSKLPVECRKVFELSRIKGHKYKEIADICHISIKTVEAQMSKALRLLRVELSDYLTLLLLFSSFLNHLIF